MTTNTTCPRCGWPAGERLDTGSTHPVSDGRVSYRQCLCGSWLILVDGGLIAVTVPPRAPSRTVPAPTSLTTRLRRSLRRLV
ncbi:hypothetical protein [Amycolatopsis sp. CA-230715]|uniref:hypothetical protein n=1 Tax=Amycolatopsis sp. CA-230715 TaxID=2745196 RepID=UPI001C012755|nr:hypothetical protein [Amycolatopsis sp. CA-230715]QWF85042.1 hypothetical protein HUW46_08495 [Amycolatopsis sp. CA-230715]